MASADFADLSRYRLHNGLPKELIGPFVSLLVDFRRDHSVPSAKHSCRSLGFVEDTSHNIHKKTPVTAGVSVTMGIGLSRLDWPPPSSKAVRRAGHRLRRLREPDLASLLTRHRQATLYRWTNRVQRWTNRVDRKNTCGISFKR